MYVIFIIVLICVQCSHGSQYVVQTKVGPISGLKATDGDYIMYLGIPYARVNLTNPFGASLPQPKFETTYEANDDSIVCPQIDEFSKENFGSLDCLRLNIYVPNQASKKPLAVLVHFFGGYFRNGSSARRLYGAKFLVRHGLIVITFNYRLGPYGFFCLDTPEVPGNQGLKDQYEALKWIKKNIAAFGGDENNITVLAHSAGAQAAEFHLLSKQPLMFDQVILQSSSALYPQAFKPADYNLPIRIAKELGFNTNFTHKALQFLAKSDTKSVIDGTRSIEFFGVCAEKEFPNVFRLVSEHPEFSEPNLEGLRIVAGFNNNEWLFGYYMDRFRRRFLSPEVFRENLNIVFDLGPRLDEMEELVRHFYLGDKEVSESTVYIILDFLSDLDFLQPVQRSINKLHRRGATIYQYLFSYSGQRNWLKNWYSITEAGATHADELAYLFTSDLNKNVPTPEDQVVVDNFTKLWTNFAKFGEPTPDKVGGIPLKWRPITKDSIPYMNIDYNLTLSSRPYHDRIAFWELFYILNEKHLRANQWRPKRVAV
ncbi:bile salt-activated lipase-like [Aricia agestis]|uniref:bile salt-activated lipase-like n=1 Tax=Aricia agestis TaxID=91739 RepID=UPI001C202AA2|nr:bile salt-activated lipase-like [Aricia agestis]